MLVWSVGLLVVILLIALGLPIAFSMMIVGFLGLTYIIGLDPALSMVGQVFFDNGMSYSLSILPLFLLMTICLFFLLFILLSKDPNDPPSPLLNKSMPIFSSVNLYNDSENLVSTNLKGKYRLFIAYYLGATRLIDNI